MEELLQALAISITPENLTILALGCAVAFVLGVLPGLSSTEAMIILLPFTFAMDLNQSMILLSSAYASAFIGGALTCIVFGIPGSSTNLTTTLDGYPLHKQGRTVFAVSVASTSSALGGIASLAVVVLMLPVMEPLSLLFGPAEWFAFVVFGLVVLAFSGEAPPIRGLISGGLGLLAGTVGLGVVTGMPRYTFGLSELWGGIPIIAAFVGLYPLAEALWMATGREVALERSETGDAGVGRAKGQVLEGIVATLRRIDTVVFSGAIGWIIGVVPGVGATLASVLGYLIVRDFSKDSQNFGKGDARGLIAAEAANNASVGGALIPALALGIPGSINTAILLGVFLINGVQPGTNVFTDNLTVTWVILLAVASSTVLSSGLVLVGAWRLVRVISTIPPKRIAPVIAFIGFVAVLLSRGNPADLLIAVGLAVLGYLMKIYRFSRISFVIALMLGPIVESSFFQALSIGRGSYGVFVGSTVSVMIWLAIIACLLLQAVRVRRSGARMIWKGE